MIKLDGKIRKIYHHGWWLSNQAGNILSRKGSLLRAGFEIPFEPKMY